MAAWLAPLGLVRAPLALDAQGVLLVPPLVLRPCTDVTAPAATARSCRRLQASLALVPQLGEPDLGARMRHAFQHVLAAGHRRAAIVGTDIPDVGAGLVERALAALDSHQVRAGSAPPLQASASQLAAGRQLARVALLPPPRARCRQCSVPQRTAATTS